MFCREIGVLVPKSSCYGGGSDDRRSGCIWFNLAIEVRDVYVKEVIVLDSVELRTPV